MRYAIVSDIHANLGAWKTALADIADMRVDRIVCLGDVVGYGAEPVEVLESVHRKAFAVLMGNHDAAVCGKMDPQVFTSRARQAVERHRGQVSEAGLRWLAQLPLVLNAPGFRCAHGDFSAPAAYHYILDAEEAVPSWRAVAEQLLFVGHTHCQGIHVVGKSGTPHALPAGDFTLEQGKRYIVNPGSIGYPRSQEGRSTYCIYDDRARTVIFRSLPFDHESYVASLRNAGFEVEPWLERQEAAQSVPALRERLSFAKPLAEHQHAQQVKRETRIFSPRFVRMIVTLLVLGLLGIAGGAVFTMLHFRHQARYRSPSVVMVPDYDLMPLNAYPLVPPDKNLLPEFPSVIGGDKIIPGWRYGTSDKQNLGIGTTNYNGVAVLDIWYWDRQSFSLESPLISLAGTQIQSVRIRGRVFHPEHPVLFLLVTYAEKDDGTLEQLATDNFEVRNTRGERPNTFSINRKVNFSKRVTHLQFRAEARFKGGLVIEQPVLTAEETVRRGR
ncbi:MAG: metallophosphatase family protein [Kiritimatiellaeota bacterium]|nr:metallophosphatase family protein [Kiritimatiellota bacterium]